MMKQSCDEESHRDVDGVSDIAGDMSLAMAR
jgi:hypothetical protein